MSAKINRSIKKILKTNFSGFELLDAFLDGGKRFGAHQSVVRVHVVG
jgi:hypothetical protein